jgi:surface antigen
MSKPVRTRVVALAAATLLGGATLAAGAQSASAMVPPPDGGGLSALRQATVDRAKGALTTRWEYHLNGTAYLSTLDSATRNVLENSHWTDANQNHVEFNDYNGNPWCGDFAAYTWTNHMRPNEANFPRLPTNYEYSLNWRNVSGYRAFPGNKTTPTAGDVLVWRDNDDSSHGHVGVVVSVNYDTKAVTTVEGNVSGDEVRKISYSWSSTDGYVKSGKTFLGVAPRE